MRRGRIAAPGARAWVLRLPRARSACTVAASAPPTSPAAASWCGSACRQTPGQERRRRQRRQLPHSRAVGGQEAALLQALVHRGEGELAQHAAQPRLAARKIRVMPEAREGAYLDAWLPRIQFPGVQVEGERPAAAVIDLLKPRARQP